MKSIIRRCKVAAICLCILAGGLSFHTVSQAKIPETGKVNSANILSYEANLTISDNGEAQILGTVRSKTGAAGIYGKVTLQKYESGTWVDVEEWEKSTNGSYLLISEKYQVTSGTYRVVLNCTVNSENKTATSSTKTY